MSPPLARPRLLLPLALACAVCAVFWVPAWKASRGMFPAPLDDVYIHFDFARAFAEGHPFEWIPGQGYSSGETSPLYAVVLGAGHLIGFHERALGLWAAIVAVLSLAFFARCLLRLLGPMPWWMAMPCAAIPLSLGVVDWTLVSGMEMAALVACLGGTLVALDRTRQDRRSGPTREALQWRLGAWGAALVLFRPESLVLVFAFAVVASRGVGRRSAILALARATLPGALATAFVLGANYLATGDARSAGAQLKLLSSNPYLTDVDRARAFVENVLTFALRGFRAAVGPAFTLLPILALVGAFRRSAAAGAILGAIGWTVMVSWNGNSPFHNYRYYAPAVILFMTAATLGLAALARKHMHLASIAATALVMFDLEHLPAQVEHYGRAVANVRDQQIEVGTRLANATPVDARILVGDAGAIPYVSRRTSIDAMGLGGYRRMPFAAAAVYGEAATLELIERLDPTQRPTHFALYPNWFGAITSRFGIEIDRVTIADNLICGGPTKGIYLADWSALGLPGATEALDEIDVADVVSEAEHGYAPPVPVGGWTTLDVLTDAGGRRRFDGGRIIPEGARESFVVRHAPADGRARITLRIDPSAGVIRARARDVVTDLMPDEPRDGSWRLAIAELDDVRVGDTITLEAARGAYRDYHVWITTR